MEGLILNMLRVSEFLHTNERLVLAGTIDNVLATILKFADIAFAEKTFFKKLKDIISHYGLSFDQVFSQLEAWKTQLVHIEYDWRIGLPEEEIAREKPDFMKRVILATDEIYNIAKPFHGAVGMESKKWGDIMQSPVETWMKKYKDSLQNNV